MTRLMNRENVLPRPRPYLQYRACSRKKQYRDQGLADLHAAILTQKEKTALRSYKCQYCHQYHVGHVEVQRNVARISGI